MSKLTQSVEEPSEGSPIDRSVGRKQVVKREAEVERDERIAARPRPWRAEPKTFAHYPRLLYSAGPGVTQESAARRAKASLDCT